MTLHRHADPVLPCAQTDMGTENAPRPAEDGAKAISWAFTSSKARPLSGRLIRARPAELPQFAGLELLQDHMHCMAQMMVLAAMPSAT